MSCEKCLHNLVCKYKDIFTLGCSRYIDEEMHSRRKAKPSAGGSLVHIPVLNIPASRKRKKTAPTVYTRTVWMIKVNEDGTLGVRLLNKEAD